MVDNQWTCPAQSRFAAWSSKNENIEALSGRNLSARSPTKIPTGNSSSHDDLNQVLCMIDNLSSRFRFPTPQIEMADFGVSSLTTSTRAKCKWAADLFEAWRLRRNVIANMDDELSVIESELANMTKEEICNAFSRFISEVKKQNGEEYSAGTVYSIVNTLQIVLEMQGRPYQLLQDPSFFQLRKTLDWVMRIRGKQCICGANENSDVLTEEEEDLLWNSGVLGTSNPKQLLDTILFLNGFYFTMRAGEEHRSLRWENSQIKVMTDSAGMRYLRYAEDTSDANQGDSTAPGSHRKILYAYENKRNRERCIVTIFQLYNKHCPETRKAFYLRPLAKPKGPVWFSTQPVEMKTLSQTVGRICREAGIHGHRSNESLRPTPATQLFPTETEEQKITEIYGHDHKAVRKYKRNGTKQRPASEFSREDGPNEASEFNRDDDVDESSAAKSPSVKLTDD